MTVLAEEADKGFKNAANYDQYRPSYPSEAVEKLLVNLKVAGQENARIVEVAAGTGKFTALLADRKEQFEIVAVEPHNEMRWTLETKKIERVKVVPGDGANIPVEAEWGDALIVAQAFHWFANLDSLREFHRVLCPGTAVGLIWNVEDYNAPQSWTSTTNWEQKLNDLIWTMDDGKPRFRHQKWKDVFENQLGTTPLQVIRDNLTQNLPLFSVPLGEDTVAFTTWLSEQALWDRLATLSQIAVLQGTELQKVKDVLAEALKGDDVERNDKGEIAVHGRTFIAWTSRV